MNPFFRSVRFAALTAALSSASFLAAGCGDDEKSRSFPEEDGGADGSAQAGAGGKSGAGGKTGAGGKAASAGGSSSGGAGAGGAGGKATSAGGADSDAGAGGAEADSGTGGADAGAGGTEADSGTGGADSGTGGADAGAEGGPDGEADGGTGLTGVVVAAVTDFATTQFVTVDLVTRAVSAPTVVASDMAFASSGGRTFILDRVSTSLVVLSSSGTVEKTIPLNGGDGGFDGYVNLHDAVLVANGPKVYVSVFSHSAVLVVDVEAGTVEKTISLAALLDPSDADGTVDVDRGFYDSATKRVYFAVHRTNILDLFSEPNLLSCPPVPSLLVAIDTETDELLDLNGGDAGPGIDLSLVDPIDVAYDPTAGRALVLQSGCFDKLDGGGSRVSSGIEALLVGPGTTRVLVDGTFGLSANRFIPLASGSFLVELFNDAHDYFWREWTVGSDTLGDELQGVPTMALAGGEGKLVGLRLGSTNAGPKWSVVTYDIATETTAPFAELPTEGTLIYPAGLVRLH